MYPRMGVTASWPSIVVFRPGASPDVLPRPNFKGTDDTVVLMSPPMAHRQAATTLRRALLGRLRARRLFTPPHGRNTAIPLQYQWPHPLWPGTDESERERAHKEAADESNRQGVFIEARRHRRAQAMSRV